MTNTELGTKLGDALAWIENMRNLLLNENVEVGKDIETELWMVLKTDVDNASRIVNELYTNYVKFDEKKGD